MQPRGGFPGAGPAGSARAGPLGAASPPAAGGGCVSSAHVALLYGTTGEFAQSVGGFVMAGLDAGDPVMVAVPAPHARVIRSCLGDRAGKVVFADMAALGRNPGRIIPAVQAFADTYPGQLVRYIGESVWPARTAAEQAEAMRHEALLNVAFGEGVRILCPYDAHRLRPELIAAAERAHPVLIRNGHLEHSSAYAGATAPPDDGRPLPKAPAQTSVLSYRNDPGAARNFVRDLAAAAGLREPRLTDLVIAVGELAANTLRHTRAAGSVRVWTDSGEVICEVRDSGRIRDALAGRRSPAPEADRGHGLWVVHQLCDLVEMRTGAAGTVFRLHMAL